MYEYFKFKHEAALLIDGLFYFNKKISSIIGTDMNRLFGMNNVSLRRSEIYINKNKGTKCTFDLNSNEKWLLGSYVLNLLKVPMVKFCNKNY